MYLFDGAFIAVPCPQCAYEIDLQFRLIQLEDFAFCPCCKARISFTDEAASGHRARRNARAAIVDLERQIENLSRTFNLNI